MFNTKFFIVGVVAVGLFLIGGCRESSEVVTTGYDTVASEADADSLPASTVSVIEKRIMVRSEISYLDKIIPPCEGTKNSDVDPCASSLLDEPETLSVDSSFPGWILLGLPTFTEILLDRDSVITSIHLIIRGVPKIDSTRCDAYPLEVANYDDYFSPEKVLFLYCFADIDVREYIVGTGPSELTVAMHREGVFNVDIEDWEIAKDEELYSLSDPRSRTAEAYEGKELVMFLGVPDTIAVETFEIRGMAASVWFIQRSEDKIRAVSADYKLATNEQERRQLNMPYNELVTQLKQADKERDSITGGRVGIESSLPLLVTDANFLQDYYVSVGAVYDDSEEATVLPPPVPGEGDPVPVTVPVNEGEVTVVSSVPVPGEEVTVPPSDDAGLTVGQSTTTTVVDTVVTSTTTVVEPPVTTEVVPAVTTTSEVVENTTTTTTVGTTTVTGTTTTTVAPVSTTVVSGGEDGTPLTEGNVPGEDQVSTTTSLVQSQSTTTTMGGEDGTPLTEDSVPGEGQVSTTTSLVQPQPTTTTTTTTLPGGDDIGPGEDSGIVPPADDGNEEEGQAGTGLAVDDG